MIVVEIHGEFLMIPEKRDTLYIDEVKNRILSNKRQAFKYLKEAYLRYRNIDGLILNETEKNFIYETIKKPLSLSERIKIICGTGTIRGAIINDIIINRAITLEEYSKRINGISFYQSNC